MGEGRPNISDLGNSGLQIAERRPVVFAKGDEVFASSRDVADYFGKGVKHVHEAIRNLIEKEPSLGLRNFRPNYINDLTGASVGHYEMDRDGFTLLAMGFTGAKALKWKLKYIEAFNLMEAELKKPRLVVDPSDPKVMLAVFEHLQGQVQEKDQVIAHQGERLKTLNRLEGARGSMCISDAAKTLKVKRHDLIVFMQSRRWIFKRAGNKNWLAYDDKRHAGYMEHDDHIYFDGEGRERVSTRALVTAKGLVKLSDLLEQPLH